MNKFVRNSALCAYAALAFSVATSSAHAGDMIGMSQQRLTDLGYFTGREDGIMGSQMMDAIRNFQASNALPVTGTLNSETFNLLMAEDFRLHHGSLIATIPSIAPIAPIAYATPFATPYVTTAAITHVAYYEDSNGFNHMVASPTIAINTPVAYTTPAVTPVAYYAGAYGSTIDAAWHY